MKKFNSLAPLLVLAFCFMAFSLSEKAPEGWFKSGSEPNHYEMGVDTKVYKEGSKSAFIQSTSKEINGFGTLMQSCLAEGHLGKKIKMSGYIKSEDVSGWAGFWFRVDGESGEVLSFDNMEDRSIEGTTDWKKYEIILKVPEGSSTLNYGALLSGTGKIWFDQIAFEEAKVEMKSSKRKLKGPTNTSFED